MSFRNEGDYGKDNRILHTGEISENSNVGSGASTRKGDRVPLEHDEVSLERVRLGRDALTIGRYQRSTVAYCAVAPLPDPDAEGGEMFGVSERPLVRCRSIKTFLIVAERLRRPHICLNRAHARAYRQA